jgi:hypothetical protein
VTYGSGARATSGTTRSTSRSSSRVSRASTTRRSTPLRTQVPALEERLAAELSRFRPAAPRPFRFELVAPVTAASPPPAPTADGPVDLAQHTMALSTWTKDIDTRAGVDPDLYDVRIYLALRKPRHAERTLVEGRSEQGGRRGIVEVELDVQSPELPLIVVAHELMHTLGATDKYDAQGLAREPDGLAEPDRVPLYPQRYAEIMARNRPVARGRERVPEGFSEIAIGPATAREIGWLR